MTNDTKVSLTGETVVSLTNSIIALASVVNPGLAGAALVAKGAIALVNTELIPAIKQLTQKGALTEEQEAKFMADYQKFRDDFPHLFEGAHWNVD
jgi:hypothetical protein